MNRVVHFEIHAENVQRAQKFYSSLFGWKFTKWNGPIDYWTIDTGSKDEPGINGGLVMRKGVIDGQAVTAYPKMPIPGMGWLAYLKDTEGNTFGIMQADPSAT